MRLAALFVLVAGSVFATGAAATAPPVVKHTYKVSYRLKGHFHQVQTFTEADGYCNGSSYVEDADFAVTAGGQITVKLQSGIAVGAPGLSSPEPGGTWTMKGQVVSDGAECSTMHSQGCNGTLAWVGGSPHAHLFVVSRGHLMGFSYSTSIPHEVVKANDCDATGDSAPPPPENSLQRALAPYQTVGLAVPLATLAARTVVSGTAKPVNVPTSYSLATCNHEAGCTATITRFSSTIKLTRVR